MSENVQILYKKLDYLSRMRADVQHSLGKLPGPLKTIHSQGVKALTPDERETLSAFTTRFASYQEQLGKAMRGVTIEEEAATEPFGSILALMEKLGVLDSRTMWKEVRDLRNSVNHDYEEDAQSLHQVLVRMNASAPWLMKIHANLEDFIQREYPR